MSAAEQPVSNVQWVDRESLSANSWNPNHQAPPEHRLLATSIIENGWTQPIVVREHDGGARLEIVDGYHRWLASGTKDVHAMTDGFVPVVILPETTDNDAKMATIRHNRARGTHGVVPMADIVVDLLESGVPAEEIQRRLGMDDEEVDRLADRGVMVKRGAKAGFTSGWTV
jgi:ParB-like chromosome segregation protein Spo0J